MLLVSVLGLGVGVLWLMPTRVIGLEESMMLWVVCSLFAGGALMAVAVVGGLLV